MSEALHSKLAVATTAARCRARIADEVVCGVGGRTRPHPLLVRAVATVVAAVVASAQTAGGRLAG